MDNGTVSGLSCSLEQPLYFSISQLTTKCLHTSKTGSVHGEWCRFWNVPVLCHIPSTSPTFSSPPNACMHARQKVTMENGAVFGL